MPTCFILNKNVDSLQCSFVLYQSTSWVEYLGSYLIKELWAHT